MMSEPPSFYQFSENEISNNSSNKPGEKKTRNGNNQFYPEITGNLDDGESELACNTIEFGFEVNVLDLIRYHLYITKALAGPYKLKVRQFQNEFMKSSFLPKYEQNILRISALASNKRSNQKSL